jgi:GntR family transcriptional regulator
MARSDPMEPPRNSAEAFALDRQSPLPIYVQIKRRLLSLIASWDRMDHRFYTDDELCRLFGVSRMTVRQAVQGLVDAGLLARSRGRGTTVVGQKIDEHFGPKMDFIDQWATHGRPLKLTLLEFDQRPCPTSIAPLLDLAPKTPVRYVERLRFAGGIPISWDKRYLTLDAGRGLSRTDVKSRSLLDVINANTPLDHGDIRIEATLARGDDAERLQLLPGDPVLVREAVYADKLGRPAMAGHSIYRADQARYSMRVPLGGAAESEAQGRGEWGAVVEFRKAVS